MTQLSAVSCRRLSAAVHSGFPLRCGRPPFSVPGRGALVSGPGAAEIRGPRAFLLRTPVAEVQFPNIIFKISKSVPFMPTRPIRPTAAMVSSGFSMVIPSPG